MWDLLPTKFVAKVKQNINSVEVHPQLSNNGHPVDGALVGVLVHCGLVGGVHIFANKNMFNIVPEQLQHVSWIGE
jgi:hypothetical protein